MTFSIIHYKWALPASACFNVSVKRSVTAYTKWPPPRSTYDRPSPFVLWKITPTFWHILNMWHIRWKWHSKQTSQAPKFRCRCSLISFSSPSKAVQLFVAEMSPLTFPFFFLFPQLMILFPLQSIIIFICTVDNRRLSLTAQRIS